MRIQIRVAPKSRVDAVEIERGGQGARIRVRVRAAAEGGKANDAVIALLAERLDVPRQAVRVAGGTTSRTKWIEIDGLEEVELWRRLEAER